MHTPQTADVPTKARPNLDLVTPAKAGVQCSARGKNWVPACAGTTWSSGLLGYLTRTRVAEAHVTLNGARSQTITPIRIRPMAGQRSHRHGPPPARSTSTSCT
jgi:hypothetical protein